MLQILLNNFIHAQREELQHLFGQTYVLTAAKLDKYLTPEGQPELQSLKDIQFFNPNGMIFFSGAEDVTAIKELENASVDEIEKYMTKLGPACCSNVSLITDPSSPLGINVR
ncbi:hypothetical protein PoB_002888000 [Plakobranchus ocellatus]|uniref:Uncharacterized protein n=1 Tax=Plakobranchus ocellatus TaxID=259542 RepID=A0AAV4A4P4_9GAST|nr:hypothetical protein PoB_002888000 [Plakobranchus ocellatus]